MRRDRRERIGPLELFFFGDEPNVLRVRVGDDSPGRTSPVFQLTTMEAEYLAGFLLGFTRGFSLLPEEEEVRKHTPQPQSVPIVSCPVGDFYLDQIRALLRDLFTGGGCARW